MTVQMNASRLQAAGGWASDAWGMVELYPGDRVYGGIPGQGIYYFDRATLSEFALNPQILWDALQVPPHRTRGFRTEIAEYSVLHPVCVPAGRCTRNAVYGSGGGFQYMIVAYDQILARTGTVIYMAGGGIMHA